MNTQTELQRIYLKAGNKENLLKCEMDFLRSFVSKPTHVIFSGETLRNKTMGEGILLPVIDFYDVGIMRTVNVEGTSIGVLVNRMQIGGQSGFYQEIGLAKVDGIFPKMKFEQLPASTNYRSRKIRDRGSLEWEITEEYRKGAVGIVHIGKNLGSINWYHVYMRQSETYGNNPGFWAMLQDRLKMRFF